MSIENDATGVWQWYAGRNEEQFELGPCPTREAAIDEGRGNYDDDGFFVVEARKEVIDLARHFDIGAFIEQAAEAVEDEHANDDYFDNGGPVFDPTPEQEETLARMLRMEIRRWQELQGLNIVPWSFSAVRNMERIEGASE